MHLEQEKLKSVLDKELVNLEEILSQLEIEVNQLTSLALGNNSVSSTILSNSLSGPQQTAQTLYKQDTELSDGDFGLCDKCISGEGSSTSSESSLSREEENTENGRNPKKIFV